MILVWSLVSACLLVASTLATFLTMLHLRCRWDVRASSVRWLFWFFFLWVFIWCFMRAIFFVWMVSIPVVEVVEDYKGRKWTYSQLDRVGIHGVLAIQQSRRTWLTIVLCVGDTALCGIALTLFPLTYELWRLARKSMDRGVKKERVMIGRYCLLIVIGLALFATAQIALVSVYGSYDIHTYRCVLVVYAIEFCGMAFMASLLVLLKVNGRKYETIHGTFVESPLYRRLRNIMLVFSLFSFVFQLATLIINVYDVVPSNRMLDYIGVSLISYNASGLMLAITTSCSQACIFSACRHCLPENFEAEFMYQRFTVSKAEDIEAPSVNPVFVFTDIESSTALWNLDSRAMSAATEIHDNILRTTLVKHRGYEITTVGDAFQVAFRTIGDAVDYCVDVQLQLLLAKWPKDIDGVVPATKKLRVKGRVVFNGLRVRMGIHDASDLDGVLVQGIHAITRKKTYSGMSEIIAEYVGDLGSGGQILMTERVASWVRHHRKEVKLDVFMDFVGNYTVPQINVPLAIYQLQPAILASRAQLFSAPVRTPDPLTRQRGGSGRFQFGRSASGTILTASSTIGPESWGEMPPTIPETSVLRISNAQRPPTLRVASY